MAQFARIIELKNKEQVLLQKAWDSEQEMYDLKITASFDGGVATVTMQFMDENVRDNAFLSYTDEMAESSWLEMSKMYS